MAEKTVVPDTTKKPVVEQKPTTEVPPVDYQKQIEDKNALIAKLTEERDSYKQGTQKWQNIARQRGINPEDFPEDEKISILVEQKVQEQLKSSQITQQIAERDALITKLNTELSEAKIALKNRPPEPTATGTNDDKPEVKEVVWTEEQLAYFKKRSLDPKKVSENLRTLQGS